MTTTSTAEVTTTRSTTRLTVLVGVSVVALALVMGGCKRVAPSPASVEVETNTAAEVTNTMEPAPSVKGYTLSNGALMQVAADNTLLPVKNDVMVQTGAKVMLNGDLVAADGTKSKLKAGEVILLDGSIVIGLTDKNPDTLLKTPITVALSEQNASGVRGTATITEENGKVVVTIQTQGGTQDVPQPAHIHDGSCAVIGAVTYPLTSVVGGTSVTKLAVNVTTLLKTRPWAINLHKSASEANIYTACGDKLVANTSR